MPVRPLGTSVSWALVAGGALVALTCTSTADPRSRWEGLPPVGDPWSLSQFYGEDWDRAVIGCPYDTPEQLTAEQGSAWTGPDMSLRDDVQVVVLLEAGRVVGQETTSRNAVDLCSGALTMLAPGTALVQEREGDHVRTRLVASTPAPGQRPIASSAADACVLARWSSGPPLPLAPAGGGWRTAAQPTKISTTGPCLEGGAAVPGHLLLHGLRIVKISLLTAGLCTTATVTIALAAGETAYAAWLGTLGALVGAASGVVAGVVAEVVRGLAARGSASTRVQRWAQALAGGTSAGSCAGLVLQAPALQAALAAVGLLLIASAAVHLSAVGEAEATARA